MLFSSISKLNHSDQKKHPLFHTRWIKQTLQERIITTLIIIFMLSTIPSTESGDIWMNQINTPIIDPTTRIVDTQEERSVELFEKNQHPIKNETESNINLPDLHFVELRAWWGALNTTGIFIDYDVTNSGETYQSNEPISSNLTFFADDNETPFDFLVQKPLFYPNMWYKDEILGGLHFLKLDKKPITITAWIDFDNNITESNEDNNKRAVPVHMGVKISGNIFERINGQDHLYRHRVELNQYDDYSLNSNGYRHFVSDENGSYTMYLYPQEPLNVSHIYHIIATIEEKNLKIIKTTDPLTHGDNTTVDIIIDGNPPQKPLSPLGLRFGRTKRKYFFISLTRDHDRDPLYYKFKWGDNTYSDWIGPHPSFYPIITTHTWSNIDRFEISVISKDANGMLSEFSKNKTFTVIK